MLATKVKITELSKQRWAGRGIPQNVIDEYCEKYEQEDGLEYGMKRINGVWKVIREEE